jgi:hypothetical protein
MRPCGTKLPLQFGQPVHARKPYATFPPIDTFIYLQPLSVNDLGSLMAYMSVIELGQGVGVSASMTSRFVRSIIARPLSHFLLRWHVVGDGATTTIQP